MIRSTGQTLVNAPHRFSDSARFIMTTAIPARAVVRVTRRLIATAAIATLVGCQSHPVYRQPPADSFTTITEQMQGGGVVTTVQSAHVTRDFFKATGVQPLVGRLFLDGEHTGEATRAVVLSHDLWAGRFESSPNV